MRVTHWSDDAAFYVTVKNLKDKRMKTALITGANQGIGREVARQLAELGYRVYIGYRNASKGRRALEQLKAAGWDAIDGLLLDVTDTDLLSKARQKLESEIPALDLLINNAAIAGEQPQQMASVRLENLRAVFETNFFGAVQTAQTFLPLLRRAEDPRIVNVSSEMGSLTVQQHTQNPNRGMFDAYSCSKAALNAFTVMLARAYPDSRIKVYSVTPGYTATNLNQYKGAKAPEEGARIVVRYATQEGDEMNGRFFKQDGEVAW